MKYKLLPPRREPVPAPERLKKVSEKYHHIVGEHDDHPGEGKGAPVIDSPVSPADRVACAAQHALAGGGDMKTEVLAPQEITAIHGDRVNATLLCVLRNPSR